MGPAVGTPALNLAVTECRDTQAGILFVLKPGIAWEDFPHQMGCRGMTLWNRLNARRKAGLWKKLHALLMARLHEADQLDWTRATVDSASVRGCAVEKTGPNPVAGRCALRRSRVRQ